ncbi:MAG: pyrroline-5-carboxylate reductase [Acidimicrobiia bacterium]|nr:pyrroline-5-carboxylate reductase [Acidimicrobiia bacterium]
MSRAAILGAGAMGTMIADGLVRSGWSRDSLVMCARRPARIEELIALGYVATTDPVAAIADADIVILSTKPKDVGAVLGAIRDHITNRQVVLSVAAGIEIATLEAALPDNPLFRAMPNTPAGLGRGATGFAVGPRATGSDIEAVRRVLESVGLAVQVTEDQLNAVTALSGSGPAYVFLLAEALQSAGHALGLAHDVATDLSAHTIAGAGAMLVAGMADAATLRQQVTSPGGTTAAAVDVMLDAGFLDIIERALTAARDRAVELGQAR